MTNSPIGANAQMNGLKIAPTATTGTAYTMLQYLQKTSRSRIWCDPAGVGKTVTLRYFAATNPFVFYVDCSLNKTRAQMIRALADALGIEKMSTYKQLLDDICGTLRSLDHPIVLWDEAGDLNHSATLEIKAICNAVNPPDDHRCAFIMAGAMGLKKKMETLMAHDKVGYEELMSRFGDTVMSLWPKLPTDRAVMFRGHAQAIADANLPGVPLNELLKASENEQKRGESEIKGLRRLADNIEFYKKGVKKQKA